jgi:allantoin racemase
MKERRILVINPNTAKATAEQMEVECRKHAFPGTRVDATYIQGDSTFSSYKVFCYVDLAICTVETVKIGWQKRNDYDGIIVAGFSDVGIDALKEILDIPVLGIAEASYHVASLIGHRFSVLTGTTKWTPPKHDYIMGLGVEAKAASFRSYSEWDDNDTYESLKKKLIEVSKKCIEEDGAEVIILGGGPLVGYGKQLEKELGIPIIDPTICALKMMEGFIDLGYKQSKVCRWKQPMASLGDASGAIEYNRAWLDKH